MNVKSSEKRLPLVEDDFYEIKSEVGEPLQNKNEIIRAEEVCVDVPPFAGTIIIAEDNKSTLMAMKHIMIEMGLGKNCSYCLNGQQAINQASDILFAHLSSNPTEKSKPITSMLLDVQMPFKTGFQVVEEVRQLFKLHKEKVDPPDFMILSKLISP